MPSGVDSDKNFVNMTKFSLLCTGKLSDSTIPHAGSSASFGSKTTTICWMVACALWRSEPCRVVPWSSKTLCASDLHIGDHSISFLPEASFGHWVLSLPASVCVCVRVCVSLCVNHLLVRAITRDPFKLGSPNLDQRCKRPWLRSLLFIGGQLTLTFKVKFNLKVWIYCILSLFAHYSLPIQARITKFGPEVQNSLVKISIVLGGIWPWPKVKFDLNVEFFWSHHYWKCITTI